RPGDLDVLRDPEDDRVQVELDDRARRELPVRRALGIQVLVVGDEAEVLGNLDPDVAASRPRPPFDQRVGPRAFDGNVSNHLVGPLWMRVDEVLRAGSSEVPDCTVDGIGGRAGIREISVGLDRPRDVHEHSTDAVEGRYAQDSVAGGGIAVYAS